MRGFRGSLIITDPEWLRTKLVTFNEDGKVLGEIDTRTGSPFHDISGEPIALIDTAGPVADAPDPEGSGIYALDKSASIEEHGAELRGPADLADPPPGNDDVTVLSLPADCDATCAH